MPSSFDFDVVTDEGGSGLRRHRVDPPPLHAPNEAESREEAASGKAAGAG
jgi:hypothetical protein